MKHSATPKKQRCAIYTRKSTEHNLDLAFNSLDAQREACEAYIKSQAHEGWSLVPTAFDDGGLSGASLHRPALQMLLDAVRAKKIDIIVVYKVDRLTRSLADFAKLVELFDECEVSFVSVTQSFNTTSSMGRLTLNVLLSFAQFEREVIGERVRDKIAASKRKGIWVGGPVPLGYRSVNKQIEIVPEQAEFVRRIFSDYLRLGSISAVVASLNNEGLRPKARLLTNGRSVQAAFYRVAPMAHLLKNRFYIGEVAYKGEVHPGGHPAILTRELFEAVQDRLAQSRFEHSAIRSLSPAILAGKLFDDRGHAMSPSHVSKAGVRYRYYVSQALLQGRKGEEGSVARVSALEVEKLTLAAIRTDASDLHPGYAAARDLIEQRVHCLVVTADGLVLTMNTGDQTAGEILTLPFTQNSPPRKGVTHASTLRGTIDDKARSSLLTAIARARRWIDSITDGSVTSFDDIAARESLDDRHVRFLASLAFLSPRIVEAIAEGRAPAGISVTDIARSMPMSWAAQEKRFADIERSAAAASNPASQSAFSHRVKMDAAI